MGKVDLSLCTTCVNSKERDNGESKIASSLQQNRRVWVDSNFNSLGVMRTKTHFRSPVECLAQSNDVWNQTRKLDRRPDYFKKDEKKMKGKRIERLR